MAFLTKSFEAAKAVLKPGGAFYIWHADTEGYNFRLACRQAGLQVRQCLILVKNSITLGRQSYQWQHEPCLYGWKDGAAHYFTFDRTQATVIDDEPKLKKMTKDELIAYAEQLRSGQGPTTVIREKKPNVSREHPTMKPIKLIARLITNSSKRGQIVGDFFGGSGSTLMACEQLDRRCYTMELDPHYADVIIDRWQQLTDKQAVKISG